MIDIDNKKEVVQESARRSRGDLGVATAGDTIKKRHRAEGNRLSLKVFARSLLKSGDQVAKDWFAHKKGALNQGRNDGNIKVAMEARAATKAAKKKKKGQ